MISLGFVFHEPFTIQEPIFNYSYSAGEENKGILLLGALNRPFPSSPLSLFQSESKCEIFVMVISSNFNMNES